MSKPKAAACGTRVRAAPLSQDLFCGVQSNSPRHGQLRLLLANPLEQQIERRLQLRFQIRTASCSPIPPRLKTIRQDAADGFRAGLTRLFSTDELPAHWS